MKRYDMDWGMMKADETPDGDYVLYDDAIERIRKLQHALARAHSELSDKDRVLDQIRGALAALPK